MSCRLGTVGSPPPEVELLLDDDVIHRKRAADAAWNAGADLWTAGRVTWSDLKVVRDWQGRNLFCKVKFEVADVTNLAVSKEINVAYEPLEVQKRGRRHISGAQKKVSEGVFRIVLSRIKQFFLRWKLKINFQNVKTLLNFRKTFFFCELDTSVN